MLHLKLALTTASAPFLFAFVVSLILVPVARAAATRLGFVSLPREDRWHRRPIALFGGVGLIRQKVQDFAQTFDVQSKNDFGFDLGAGVMGFFSQNVGLRGDVCYFRSFSGSSDNVTGLGLSNFNFWRASLGVSFKF